MKIFDCFMYFDEETVLELRLNILDRYVDYFVIVESSFTHKGDKRDLKFNHQKFKKFQDKIIYITYDEEPLEIAKNQVSDKDNEIYLVKIVNSKSNTYDENDENYLKFVQNQITDNRKSILGSYDQLLNSKYKVQLNQKTIDRVKNYFK